MSDEKALAFAESEEVFREWCKLRGKSPDEFIYIQKPEELDNHARREVYGIGDYTMHWRMMFNQARERGIHVIVVDL